MNRRVYVAGGATIAIFVLVQIGALVLIEPFQTAGYQPVKNPSNPTNTFLYLLGVFAATGVMLTAFRFGADRLVHVLIVGSSAFLSYYVLSVVLPPIGSEIVGATHLPAASVSIVLAIALFVYPEWYIIDTIGIIMGMGAAGLFGISLGLLPALLLLTVLAIYDAISVYKTEHMLTLASSVMDLKIPVVLVIPLTLSYSYLESPPERMDRTNENDRNEDNEESEENETATTTQDTPSRNSHDHDHDNDYGYDNGHDHGDTDNDTKPSNAESPGSRGAFFIGLGDAVMPSVLVASVAFFLPTEPIIPEFALTLPALTAMLGTLCGLVVLIKMVMEGRPHAGLPLLNGGAIVGYLLGASASGVPLVRALGLVPYL